MKQCIVIIATFALFLGGIVSARAIDFKISNQVIMLFEYGDGGLGYSETRGGGKVQGFNNREDNFEARQRIRTQVDAIVSESLSGTVYFEIGQQVWGKQAQGAALGTDGTVVKVRRAYIDWLVPHTDLQVRMGLLSLHLPNYVSGGSNVFADDVAGIILSNKITENFGITAFWARPYNDNFEAIEGYDAKNQFDNVDMFGILLPFNFSGVKMTPWLTYTSVGRNFVRANGVAWNVLSYNDMVDGILPVTATEIQAMTSTAITNTDIKPYADMWHAGFTGEITAIAPWNFAWDINYGSVDYGIDALHRHGYMVSALLEYKTQHWGTPGIYGWYSSGDDGDVNNGSERMPTMTTADTLSDLSFFGVAAPNAMARKNIIGTNFVGTWGVGVRLAHFSVLEGLSQTFRINYYGGTNHTDMGKLLAKPDGAGFSLGNNLGYNMYMTTQDSAIEIALGSRYKIYENLTFYVEGTYLKLNFDKDVWGDGYTATDAWNIATALVYKF